MKLVPANEFTIEQLVDAYNQTRIDYIVPMPMTADRLRHYIHLYDVEMSASCVAVTNTAPVGIAMLGVRNDRAWITRLGVMPDGRRRGVGQAMMEYLIDQAEQRGIPAIWLEVIQGNTPAHAMFKGLGFRETRDLLIARRPPTPDQTYPDVDTHLVNQKVCPREQTLQYLSQRTNPNWLRQTESMKKLDSLQGFFATFTHGAGWVTYEQSWIRLTKIEVGVTKGDVIAVTTALLQLLHRKHPTLDAISENIPVQSKKWEGFKNAGYFDAFHRIEMVRRANSA